MFACFLETHGAGDGARAVDGQLSAEVNGFGIVSLSVHADGELHGAEGDGTEVGDGPGIGKLFARPVVTFVLGLHAGIGDNLVTKFHVYRCGEVTEAVGRHVPPGACAVGFFELHVAASLFAVAPEEEGILIVPHFELVADVASALRYGIRSLECDGVELKVHAVGACSGIFGDILGLGAALRDNIGIVPLCIGFDIHRREPHTDIVVGIFHLWGSQGNLHLTDGASGKLAGNDGAEVVFPLSGIGFEDIGIFRKFRETQGEALSGIIHVVVPPDETFFGGMHGSLRGYGDGLLGRCVERCQQQGKKQVELFHEIKLRYKDKSKKAFRYPCVIRRMGERASAGCMYGGSFSLCAVP